MRRSDLIQQLASRFPTLTLFDTEQATLAILGAMTSALSSGDRIEIRGFGSFTLTSRAPRTGRNPKTGEPVDVPAKYALHFKPGKELADRVDTQGQ